MKTELFINVMERSEENGRELNKHLAYNIIRSVNDRMEEDVKDRYRMAEISSSMEGDSPISDDEKVKLIMEAVQILSRSQETGAVLDEKSEKMNELKSLSGLETYDKYAAETEVEIDENHEMITGANNLAMEFIRGIALHTELEKTVGEDGPITAIKNSVESKRSDIDPRNFN